MEKELRPGRRTSASLLGKISVVVLKTLAALVLIALLAVFVTSVSPIYDFAEPRPFSGPEQDGTEFAFVFPRVRTDGCGKNVGLFQTAKDLQRNHRS